MLRSRHLISGAILALTFLAPLASSVTAADMKTPAKPEEASIPFANFHGIQDWRADGSQAIYLRGSDLKQWYHATLMGPCTELPFAEAIGVEPDARDVFDQHSTIIVKGQRCALSSLAKSAPPPDK